MATKEEAKGEATAAMSALMVVKVVMMMEGDEMGWKNGVSGGGSGDVANGGVGEKC